MIEFNASLTPLRIMNAHARSLVSSLEKLSTGQRINRGADDPAGLISAESLRAQLVELDAQARVLQRSDHVATVVDGGLASVSDQLADAQALIVANANTAGMGDAERAANQVEIDAFLAGVNRTATNSTFNGQPLLDGEATIAADGETISIAPVSTSALGAVEIDGTSYTLADLGTGGRLDAASGNAEHAQRVLDAARTSVTTMRGEVGAFQRHTIATAIGRREIAIENVAAARSAVADTDFATEIVNLRSAQLGVAASILAMTVTNEARSTILSFFDR